MPSSADAADIKGKVGENLRDNLEQLELSRKLATITDMRSALSRRRSWRREPDVDALRRLYCAGC